jgi:hypothetical protein
MAAVGLRGIVSDTADPITSIPDMKATLLRSIKPMTKTKAPVTRKTGCQRVRANRRMPMTDSRAAVRSHRRSRRERAGLAARGLPAGVDRFHGGRLRRCDRNVMTASCPPGGRYRVLLCVYPIVGFPDASLHIVRSNRCLSSRGSPLAWMPLRLRSARVRSFPDITLRDHLRRPPPRHHCLRPGRPDRDHLLDRPCSLGTRHRQPSPRTPHGPRPCPAPACLRSQRQRRLAQRRR